MPPDPGVHTILVVDDDHSMLLLCKKTLEQEGFKVLQAEGSSEALKLYAQNSGVIHLLLTDLLLPPPYFQLATEANQFPRVNGPELVSRVLAMKKELRVLLMSAHSDKELANHGIKRGAVPFLQKPFNGETLISMVRQVLKAPPLVFDEKANCVKNEKEGEILWVD